MGYEKKKKKRKSVDVGVPWSPEQYELEEDLRAVTRAEAVQSDPERMKKVRALAKQKLDEYQRRKDEAQKGIELAAQG